MHRDEQLELKAKTFAGVLSCIKSKECLNSLLDNYKKSSGYLKDQMIKYHIYSNCLKKGDELAKLVKSKLMD